MAARLTSSLLTRPRASDTGLTPTMIMTCIIHEDRENEPHVMLWVLLRCEAD